VHAAVEAATVSSGPRRPGAVIVTRLVFDVVCDINHQSPIARHPLSDVPSAESVSTDDIRESP
jgi:hypothetical protein